MSADSSVVLDTLIDLLLNFNVCYSRNQDLSSVWTVHPFFNVPVAHAPTYSRTERHYSLNFSSFHILWPQWMGAVVSQSVPTVSDYRLDDRATGVRSPAEAKDFSSILCVQTSSEAHPVSYPLVTGVLSRG
jgi:hypothetical protein